jgi:twitching motility protein PilT
MPSYSGPQILQSLIDTMLENNGSDIHIGVGYRPVLRIGGTLREVESIEPMTTDQLTEIAQDILLPDQLTDLDTQHEIDFSHDIESARFRGNAYHERRGLNFSFRLIPLKVRAFESLGYPEHVAGLLNANAGLLLFTGPTGSGATTTLASAVDYINRRESKHIISIEDPIEYVFENEKSIVKQREVGSDGHTKSFKSALHAALREDPDVIVVGSVRDGETLDLLLQAADTGHLVLSTLHTNDTIHAIEHMLAMLPDRPRKQTLAQIARTLVGVTSQRLIPTLQGGLTLASEIMISNNVIRSAIVNDTLDKVYEEIKAGRSEGMMALNASVRGLLTQKIISSEVAAKYKA